MCHGIVNLADLDFLIQPLTFDLGRVDHLNDIKSFFLKCNILKLSDLKEAPAVAPSLSLFCVFLGAILGVSTRGIILCRS